MPADHGETVRGDDARVMAIAQGNLFYRCVREWLNYVITTDYLAGPGMDISRQPNALSGDVVVESQAGPHGDESIEQRVLDGIADELRGRFQLPLLKNPRLVGAHGFIVHGQQLGDSNSRLESAALVCPQWNSPRWFRSPIVVRSIGKFAEPLVHEPLARARARIVSALVSIAGRTPRRRIHMLYTVAVILLIAWLLGFVGIYTIGSFVHLLLVGAIVLFVVGLLGGRRVLG